MLGSNSKAPEPTVVAYRRAFTVDDTVNEPGGIDSCEAALLYLATLGGQFWYDPETNDSAVVVKFQDAELAKKILGAESERLKAKVAEAKAAKGPRHVNQYLFPVAQLQACERMLKSFNDEDVEFLPGWSLPKFLAGKSKCVIPTLARIISGMYP